MLFGGWRQALFRILSIMLSCLHMFDRPKTESSSGRPAKRPGMLERLALIAGLAVAPKVVASQDEVPRAPMSTVDPSRAANEEAAVQALRVRIAAQNTPAASPTIETASATAPTEEASYTEAQRQEMLRQGRALAERGFETLFSEDLGLMGTPAQHAGIDPRSLYEFADAWLDQETEHMEGTEDYRERVGGIARDFILKRMNDELLSPLQTSDVNRAGGIVYYFSAWDNDNNILRFSARPVDSQVDGGDRYQLVELEGGGVQHTDAAPGGIDDIAYRHAFEDIDHPEAEQADADGAPEDEDSPEES